MWALERSVQCELAGGGGILSLPGSSRCVFNYLCAAAAAQT